MKNYTLGLTLLLALFVLHNAHTQNKQWVLGSGYYIFSNFNKLHPFFEDKNSYGSLLLSAAYRYETKTSRTWSARVEWHRTRAEFYHRYQDILHTLKQSENLLVFHLTGGFPLFSSPLSFQIGLALTVLKWGRYQYVITQNRQTLYEDADNTYRKYIYRDRAYATFGLTYDINDIWAVKLYTYQSTNPLAFWGLGINYKFPVRR